MAQNGHAAEPALLDYIMFQHRVKEQLHENGILVDRFVLSTQGTPYFVVGGECFIAVYAQTCPNADFADPSAFLEVVAAVAKMHASVLLESTAPNHKTAAATADANKQLDSLAVLKRKLLKVGKFSEFDMLFLKGCDRLTGHIAGLTAADNEGESDVQSTIDSTRYFCHNLLKEENVFYDSKTHAITITNFSECGGGHFLFDLAYLIKRCLKAKPARVAPLDAVLSTYSAHHPAAFFSKPHFRRILLYPDKFVKVSADYYSKKRSFAPKTYISRIEECLTANDELEKYIDS